MSSLVKTAHVLFVKNLRCLNLRLRCMSPTNGFPVDSTLDLREEKKKDRQQQALQARKMLVSGRGKKVGEMSKRSSFIGK